MKNAIQKNLGLLKNNVIPESLTVHRSLVKKGIPELVSGSSTKVVDLIKKESLYTNNKRLRVEDPRLLPPAGSGMTSNGTTATVHGFASALVTPQCLYAGYSAGKQRGFTLIELLVVVLIIGILAAVALPQYQKAVLKTYYHQAKSLVYTYEKAVAAYQLSTGKWPSSFDELDVNLPAGSEIKTPASAHCGIQGELYCCLGEYSSGYQSSNITCGKKDYSIGFVYAQQTLGKERHICIAKNTNPAAVSICKSEGTSTQENLPTPEGHKTGYDSYELTE